VSSISGSYGSDLNQIIIITPCGTPSSSSVPLASLANYQTRKQLLFANYLFPSDADYLTMDAFSGSDSSSSSSGITVGQLQSNIEKMIGKSLNVARKLFTAVSSISEIERSLTDIHFECDLVSNSFLATKQVPSYKNNFIISNSFKPIRLEYSVDALETCHNDGTYRLRRNNIEFNGECSSFEGKPTLIIQRREWKAGQWTRQFMRTSFSEYKVGFGILQDEFWLGLEHIQSITQRSQGAVVSLWNIETGNMKKYSYQQFKLIGDDFRLIISGGDKSFLGSRNKPFVMTKFGKCNKDPRNDGGWWFDCEGEDYSTHLHRNLESYDYGSTFNHWKSWPKRNGGFRNTMIQIIL